MNRRVRAAARAVAVSGLFAVSGLHVLWAFGSSWPATHPRQLAEAVVGSAIEVPRPGPTAVVAAGAAGAALLASGALGDGAAQRTGSRAAGGLLLLRGILGGDAALAALGLGPPSDVFRRLDRRCYRPAALVLGAALMLASARSHARDRDAGGQPPRTTDPVSPSEES